LLNVPCTRSMAVVSSRITRTARWVWVPGVWDSWNNEQP